MKRVFIYIFKYVLMLFFYLRYFGVIIANLASICLALAPLWPKTEISQGNGVLLGSITTIILVPVLLTEIIIINKFSDKSIREIEFDMDNLLVARAVKLLLVLRYFYGLAIIVTVSVNIFFGVKFWL